jgi:glucose dehydrogenase
MLLAPVVSAPWIFAILLFLLGVALGAGGIELAALGGSWRRAWACSCC